MPELKDPNQELEVFQQEIRLIQEEEAKSGKTAHFAGKEFTPAELTLDDMAIWAEIKNETITMESFSNYKAKLENSGANVSRRTFAAFASNRANPIIGNRQMDEIEARDKKE